MTAEPNTTIASWAVLVRDTLADYDVDVDLLLSNAGISQESLADPLNRVPVSSMTKLWNAAVEATNDDAFGLKVARRVTPTTFFALGIAALSSKNVFEALKIGMKSSTLVSTGVHARIRRKKGLWVLELGTKPGFPEYAPAAVNAGLAGLLHISKQYLGFKSQLHKVSFKHKEPARTEVFESYFGCPVAFNAKHDAIYVSRLADVFGRFPTANSALQSFNAQIASDYISRLSDSSVGNRVKNELGVRLDKEDDVDQKTIARVLGMNERKLQTSLKAEGTSFQEILDWLRERKAIHLLTVEKQSVSNIALQLGFKEISSFTRAFKRWTGKTPREYLKQGHMASGADTPSR